MVLLFIFDNHREYDTAITMKIYSIYNWRLANKCHPDEQLLSLRILL